MKKVTFLLALFCLLFSCKKDNNANTESSRLEKIEWHINGDISSTSFEYDASGRINKITTTQGGLTATSATISYSSNDFIITYAPVTNTAVHITDEVRVILDGAGRPMQRIEYNFQEYFPPINAPQRTYVYDTLLYSYDASGLPLNINVKHKDTTWHNNGANIAVTRHSGTLNYSAAGGNLTAYTKTENYTHWSNQSGIINTSTGTSEENVSYSYTKQYPNKTDFTNAAILNEFGANPGLGLNKVLKNMPDKISGTLVSKDQNGTVISSVDLKSDYTLTYYNNGLLSSIVTDPVNPNNKAVYIYR